MKNRYLILSLSAFLTVAGAQAQSAIDAYRLAQPDLKGTARFMSMGGAFGALGGDLSSLSQNPGGIGVYRSSEIGFTLDLDLQNSNTQALNNSTKYKNTHFYLNNIGGVLTLRLGSEAVPNINFGFTYNKSTSYNRHYGGYFSSIDNSMTNYIAGLSNSEGLTVGDVTATDRFDPYNPNDGGIAPSWLAVLGYSSFLTTPLGDPDNPNWVGQWGQGTSGSANFQVEEKGAVDSYNIAFGGNIANVVYWGMDFDITSLNYSTNTYWGERMDHAFVDLYGDGVDPTTSEWGLRNSYAVSGTGFNYKLGLIVKPIQELRIGFAFHTPTWYNLTEQYVAKCMYRYDGKADADTQYTNDGYPGENSVRFHTPWRVIASLAGVIGGRAIISADYEWSNYGSMKYSSPSYGYYDWGTSPSYDIFADVNNDINTYYQSTNTLRVGAEYRLTNQWSARLGYSFVSSPVTQQAADNHIGIWTAGTMPEYRFDNTTNYVTAGIGYHIKRFYLDLAYVYKHMDSTYHAYTPDPESPSITSPQAKVSFDNHQIVLSAGFKF